MYSLSVIVCACNLVWNRCDCGIARVAMQGLCGHRMPGWQWDAYVMT